MSTTAPERIDNATLIAVATLFAVTVGAIGLVGYLDSGGLTTSFVSGSVSGSGNYVGAVAGEVDAGQRVSDVYWNVERAGSGVDGATGERDVDAAGLTTDEMTGAAATQNMAALDTGFAWTTTDEYPVLQWQVESVSLETPDQVLVGESASASVSLSLVDGRTVTADEVAAFSSNESFLTVSEGTIETSDTGTVELTATAGGQSVSETIDVVTPADVSLVETTLPYDRVGTDVDAPIRAVLENAGGATGDFTVEYAVDGEVVESRTVDVEGNTEQTVQYNWTAPGTGEYEIAVNGTSLGMLTVVEEPETSVASVSLDAATVGEGEAATVTAQLDNAGDAAGSHEVELTVDGETVTTKTVIVPADGRTVSFAWTADGTGGRRSGADRGHPHVSGGLGGRSARLRELSPCLGRRRRDREGG